MFQLFDRLKKGLSRTRHAFASKLANLFLGKKEIDASLLEELQKHLLEADVGPEATATILHHLKDLVDKKSLKDPQVLWSALKSQLIAWLKPFEKSLTVEEHQPHVILLVGVNGNGKTTTLGKCAHLYKTQGKRVLLAAGDTFRAAAIEQLQAWGEKSQVPVVAQKQGSDPASVLFDAYQSAKSQKIDILLADTAGRLHTKNALMDELKKVKKVLSKLNPEAPHDVVLVLDATTGQNGLQQAKVFKDALGLTGLILTKLDGTAKGGILFSICSTLQLPVLWIGIGEGIDDLKPFQAEAFVSALLDDTEERNT